MANSVSIDFEAWFQELLVTCAKHQIVKRPFMLDRIPVGNKAPQAAAFFGLRMRILIFAVFSTLVPALLFGWISYYKTHELLLNQAAQEFNEALTRSQHRLDEWLLEKLEDLSVFSRSFVLVDNLTQHLEPSSAEQQSSLSPPLPPDQQILEFLQLVQVQVPDYRSLLVLDTAGSLVSQYPESGIPSEVYGDWAGRLQPGSEIISEHRTGSDSSTVGLALGVSIVSSSQTEIGVLLTEIPILRLVPVLKASAGSEAEILLAQSNGSVLLSNFGLIYDSEPEFVPGKQATAPMPPTALQRYRNYRGVDVVGLAIPLARLPWSLVIEKPYQSIFQDVDRLRDYSLLLTLALLAGFGLLAFLVSQSVLLPLKRLTEAAAKVAQGDLNTRLETVSRDELGLTMTVFNDMVERLRANRDELQRISVTDSLTGLYNKKQIMEALNLQLERFRRSGSEFSLLMIDVDHFKRINDQQGHLAGDAALQQTGQILRGVLRSIDLAGRYGGEEFLIILEQTGARQALDTAERMRAICQQSELLYENKRIGFTVSIGVATVIDDPGETADSLIQRADRGLYRAKRNGRNRVMAGDLPTADEDSIGTSPTSGGEAD